MNIIQALQALKAPVFRASWNMERCSVFWVCNVFCVHTGGPFLGRLNFFGLKKNTIILTLFCSYHLLSKGPLSASSASVFAAVPGVPRLPPGKKPPGPPPGPPPPQVLALYGIPMRRSYGADTGMTYLFSFSTTKVGYQRKCPDHNHI